jgi:putative addiction module killer protein
MDKVVIAYKTSKGNEPFIDWLFSLKDKILRYRVEARIIRIGLGNYGDHKRFEGIIEIRLDFGKGYRLYCGEDGNRLIVLLIGGDKNSQDADIRKALEYWREYHEQKKTQDI